MLTAEEAAAQHQAWKSRIDAVQHLGETVLYITHREWTDLHDLNVRLEHDETLAGRVARQVSRAGQIGDFLATPVVADDLEAIRQAERARARVS